VTCANRLSQTRMTSVITPMRLVLANVLGLGGGSPFAVGGRHLDTSRRTFMHWGVVRVIRKKEGEEVYLHHMRRPHHVCIFVWECVKRVGDSISTLFIGSHDLNYTIILNNIWFVSNLISLMLGVTHHM